MLQLNPIASMLLDEPEPSSSLRFCSVLFCSVLFCAVDEPPRRSKAAVHRVRRSLLRGVLGPKLLPGYTMSLAFDISIKGIFNTLLLFRGVIRL